MRFRDLQIGKMFQVQDSDIKGVKIVQTNYGGKCVNAIRLDGEFMFMFSHTYVTELKNPYIKIQHKIGDFDIKKEVEEKINDGRHLNGEQYGISGLFTFEDQPEGKEYWELVSRLFEVVE